MVYFLFLGLVGGELFKLPILSFGGITLLDICSSIFCLFCLVKRPKFKPPPLFFKTGIAFILITLISQLFSPLSLTLTQRLIGISYIVRFFIYLLASLIISLNFFQLKKNTLKLLLFSGITLATLGILQLIFIPDLQFLTTAGWDPHFYRNVSTFLDPNFAGAFFGLSLIILFLLNPFSRKIYYFSFSLIFIALLTTFSRGSYLLFFVSFISISFLTKSLKNLALTLLLTTILGIGFLLYEPLIATPKNVNRTQSAVERFDTWQQGLAMFEHSPILGVGFNNYRFALNDYHLAPIEQINSHGGSTNDSSLLFVLSTTGIIGVLSYLTFLVSIYKKGFENWQQKNIWGTVVIAALSGLIAQSFFANTLFFPPLLAWILFSSSQLSDNNS